MNYSKFLLPATMLLISSAFAQSPVNFGLKAGLSNSSFNGTYNDLTVDELNNSFIMGGGFVRVNIKKWHIQGEMLYLNKGGTFEDITQSGSVISAKEQIKFSSFDVPLMIGRDLLDLKLVKVKLNGGVVSSSITSTKESDVLSSDYWADSYWSGTAGVSVDIPLFIFDVRYVFGLSEVYNQPEIGGVLPSVNLLDNNLWQVSVAWKIL